jgi:hypothetical protein
MASEKFRLIFNGVDLRAFMTMPELIEVPDNKAVAPNSLILTDFGCANKLKVQFQQRNPKGCCVLGTNWISAVVARRFGQQNRQQRR